MSRLTIYERLKPEIKQALASQEKKYSTSVSSFTRKKIQYFCKINYNYA